MMRVRQERNRLENDRKVATRRNNISENTPVLELRQYKYSKKDTRETRRKKTTEVSKCQQSLGPG